MSDKPRYVVDTNVLVDALCFANSFGRKAFDLVTQTSSIIASLETLAELKDVLSRPRLARFFSDEEHRSFMVRLNGIVVPVVPKERIQVCRDTKDDKFLELAVAGSANAIITRDADLLVLNPFRGIEITEPKVFVERLRSP